MKNKILICICDYLLYKNQITSFLNIYIITAQLYSLKEKEKEKEKEKRRKERTCSP
jgi:hypothetical protein